MPHISCTTRPMLLLSLYYILAYAALPTNTFVLNDAHRHIHNYSTIDTRTSDKILSLFSPRSWKQLQLFHLGRHARLMNSSSSASSVESHSSKFPELIELMTNELAKMNMLMSRDVFAVSVRENSSSLKQLYSQIVKNVEIRESSISDAGLGLFATKNIKAGSIVSFYPAHALGIDTGDEQVFVSSNDADRAHFRSHPCIKSCYLHCTDQPIFNRPSFVATGADGRDENPLEDYPIFLDVNPNRDLVPGW
eukprot:CAMPEP_0113300716 /NCGR_PEP_ID=MMETSP0010_2-20120614/2227_1 /TAXON_ID=216773 ORGANISM="Corethron hystrix, Strain 308" /NCGR_SAMPLE_ID=MMETSP0010_2 /ASSEMBLY_ACC=CAM_ASM_000155 /LENGTH=249 /DNA_ID=CAMNT_0000154181 /DNA_START=51 /DNA_END=797 /DNA_ORIENTATION=- /assembly_acc=CAM_ASM_000155